VRGALQTESARNAQVVTSRGRRFIRDVPAGAQVAISMLAGAVGGAIASWLTMPTAAVLIGWDTAAVIYLCSVWAVVWRADPDVTARLANREDPSNAIAELVVIAAGVLALVAVGFALLRAGHATGGTKAYLIAVGVISVVVSWLITHMVFMLRYARAYYSQPPGGIEFNEPDQPTYPDFAYFSLTLGMTFQVSDTNITSKQIRRVVLHHALLSYLFGAVILALAINVVASLLH
jgi:uncharacterized membrane protein